MNFRPREYQRKALQAFSKAVESGHRRILMYAPPGSGKGSLAAYLLAWMYSQNNRALFLVHRRDLVVGENALEDRLVYQMGIPKNAIGYAIAGKKQRNTGIMLATIQTAVNRKLTGEHPSTKFKLIIVDETHRLKPGRPGKKDGQYKQLLDRYPEAILVGFTATPERHSKYETLGQVFDHTIMIATHHWMVQNRYLVPSKMIAPVTPDLSGVRIRGGEFVEKDLEEKAYNDEAIRAIADVIKKYAQGRKGFVYTINSIKQCQRMAQLLRERGFRVATITSKTKKRNPQDPSPYDREGILESLAAGKLDLVVNVSVLVEGVSIDDVDFICLAYATNVRAKYIQSATRGDRPVWGKDGDWLRRPDGEYAKDHFLLLDCGNNWARFGFVEDYLSEGLNIHVPPALPDPNAKPPGKRCPRCGEVNHTSVKVCTGIFPTGEECLYEFPASEDTRVLANDVEWQEVDRGLDFVTRFAGMSDKKMFGYLKGARTAQPELIIPMGLANGKEFSWMVEMAVELGWATGDPKDMDDYHKILSYLDARVDRAGFRPAVEGMIRNMIML